MATAADCPTRFDLILDGQGYVFADTQEVKAELGATPTFIARQNVQGDYGDNQQDFWMAATQRDWSLGEQQRYFRGNDDDVKRRYWLGASIDVEAVAGQATIRKQVEGLTAAANIASIGSPGGGGGGVDLVYFATATNLYSVSPTAVTDHGAHGLGASPAPRGVAYDGRNVFLTTLAAGTVGIRRWNGSAFSTWSASGADSLCFLNNTLYGIRQVNGDFVRWDTAGVISSLFPWKDSTGAAALPIGGGGFPMVAFGGKLAIFLERGGAPWELWLYDGTAPALIAQFDGSFWGNQIVVANGNIFVSGYFRRRSEAKAAILYYANGTTGILWKSNSWAATGLPSLAAWNSGLIWDDPATGQLLYYNSAAGGVSTIGDVGTSHFFQAMGTSSFVLVASGTGTTVNRFPSGATTAIASSGSITTSLFDFDSSLTKRFHTIRVEFDLASDGNFGSVDIAYRLEDVDGSYTTLQTGAVSGTEYELTNISGRAISVKVTLNKGTSTSGPVLKRVAVRASPLQPQKVRASYGINCQGSAREPGSLIRLRDESQHGLTGLEMVANLKAAAAKTDAISITDAANGTFSGIIEEFKFQAVRRGEEFIAMVTVRQV